MPKIGPEKAIRTAVTIPPSVPHKTPTGLANGTKSAKKKSAKMGVTNRFMDFCVTAKILPGIY